MSEPDKVIEIFREFLGERALRLQGSHYPADVQDRITAALVEGESDNVEKVLAADSLSFHFVDWQRDAAFIVALSLFPDRFTDEEIRHELDKFMWHVPAHVLEAARLGGYPIENIFKADGENKSE